MKKFVLFVVITVALLVSAEVGLRIAGFETWINEPVEDELVWEPACPWNQDTTVGIRLNEGAFKVTYNKQHSIVLTNNKDGYRITSAAPAPNTAGKPKIKIFGDSFTQGCGINDNETYCWLLQQNLPEYAIYNYAGPGYGVANIFSQIKNMDPPRPGDVYIFAYSIEQDNRYERFSMKMINTRPDLWGKIAMLTLNDNLETEYHPYRSDMWQLSNYSALVNLTEDYWNSFLDARDTEKAHQTAKLAVSWLNNYCKQRGATFVLAGIAQRGTQDMLSYCRQEGILYTDISIDIEDKTYNQRPYNDQPNAYSNTLYAERLQSFFDKKGILKIFTAANN